MPALDNQRHELFAQELARGNSATQAYKDAGYKPNPQNAGRLTKNDDIQARVKELQGLGAIKTIDTIASIAEELNQLKLEAIRNMQVSAGVAAVMGKAKVLGLLIDKQELSGKDGGSIEIRQREIDDAKAFDAKFIEVLARTSAKRNPSSFDGSGES